MTTERNTNSQPENDDPNDPQNQTDREWGAAPYHQVIEEYSTLMEVLDKKNEKTTK